jgi:hypothetical protein
MNVPYSLLLAAEWDIHPARWHNAASGVRRPGCRTGTWPQRRPDQPELPGQQREFGAVVPAEFGQDARYIRLHCGSCQMQFEADLPVGATVGDLREDLRLPSADLRRPP